MYVKQHSYELLFYNVELRLDGILFDYYSGILFRYYLHGMTENESRIISKFADFALNIWKLTK